MNSIKIKVLLVYLLSFLLLSTCSEKVETEYVDAQKAAKLLSKYLDDPINEVKREGIVVTEIGIDEENNVLEVGFFELNRRMKKSLRLFCLKIYCIKRLG